MPELKEIYLVISYYSKSYIKIIYFILTINKGKKQNKITLRLGLATFG